MRVLVTYASERGSTAEIAKVIAEELTTAGCPADLLPVRSVRDIAPYSAVVLGSAVYFDRWRSEALHFAKHHEIELLDREVWLFESGPLDDSADAGRAVPAHGIGALAERLGAHGVVTFGGNLNRASVGYLGRHVMDSGKAGSYGDHRNFERVRVWARAIALTLRTHGSTLSAAAPLAVSTR